MSSNRWEEACAQIIHESTLSKIWPIKVPRKVGVVRTSKTMAWNIWKSTDRYIFGVRPTNKSDEPATDSTAATYYLTLQRRKSRGQNKEAAVLTQGQEPTNVTALDDARVFQAVPGLSGRGLLRHVATGRYLYLRSGDRLSFTDTESMAGGWEIDLQH